MKLFKLLPVLLLTVTFFVGNPVSAQKKSLTEVANAAFEVEHYYDAIDKYKKAYAKEKDKAQKVEILYRLGECYRHILDFKQAEVWYKKAIKAQYANPEVYHYLGDALKAQERYDEALTEYQNYLEKKPGDAMGENGAASCKLAQEWKDNPTNYEVNNEVLLNSKQFDYSPVFSDKRNTMLIFASSRHGATGEDIHHRTGESHPDLFTSKRDKKGKWSEPVILNETVNTEHSEGTATLDKRKNTLYFTRCEFDKKAEKGCRIYKAKRAGNNWGEATLVTEIATDSATVGHPAMGYEDKYLFFAAELEGGKGKNDIWYVKYDKKAKSWSAPVNMAVVNTEGNDLFPYVAANGKFYFSSDGHLGMGGLDMFVCENTGDGQWEAPKNMQYPMNSSGDDFGITFEGKKDKGYFSSTRRGGKGGDDIYSFFAPPTIYVIQGNVYDIDTKEPVADVTVKLVDNEGTEVEVKTDQTGYYEFGAIDGSKERYIQPESTYKMEVHKDKYLGAKAEETTVGIEESTTFVHDFNIQNFADPNKELEFPEVQYALGKWDLTPASSDSLNFLYQLLIDNPTLVIELSAHTDSRGSDASNQDLSQKRAQSCVDYLVEKGIDVERLVAKGYGETRLIFSDADIAKFKTKEESEAAHQKNRRTVFSVIRDDFVPKTSAPAEGDGDESGEGEGSDN